MMTNELRHTLESLSHKPYNSEKSLLETIEQLGLEAEILGNEVRRVCYILWPYRIGEPKGTHYPCFEMQIKASGKRGKVVTGTGLWW
jgi:hypothetical protein